MMDRIPKEVGQRPRPIDGPALNVADSRAKAADLLLFLRNLPLDDPRLLRLVDRGLSLDQLVELFEDDGMVPVSGEGMLGYLIERAER